MPELKFSWQASRNEDPHEAVNLPPIFISLHYSSLVLERMTALLPTSNVPRSCPPQSRYRTLHCPYSFAETCASSASRKQKIMTFQVVPLLALVLVLASLHVTSADEASPALPPADPTGQDPDPCPYNNHWEMIERLGQLPAYNDSISSLLVERCRNVCQLLHGSGNPDVTGVGVCKQVSSI